jgi:RNA polymerase sigma factor (sigma-70 family)
MHSCVSKSSSLADINSEFWQLWEKYQDYLYRCCHRWMGNPTDAEDALSRAMLKAWEKFRDGTDGIKNFKAWLIRLTRNLCVDIYRERNRGARQVESLSAVGNEAEFISEEENPVLAATQQELEKFLRGAIDELPDRLRETFILHFEQEQSYQEIAQHLNISYDNVRKRISQARVILRKSFNEYLGEGKAESDLSVKSQRLLKNPSPNLSPSGGEALSELKSSVSPQPAKRRKSKNTPLQQPATDVTVTFSQKIEEVPEESQAAVAVLMDVQSDREEIADVEDVDNQPNLNQEYPKNSSTKQRRILYTIEPLQKQRKPPLEYFMQPGKVWADSGDLATIGIFNNWIDSG